MKETKDSALQEYLDGWSSRIRGSLLEMAILYQAAYSERVYPYSMKKDLDAKWGSFSPPLPTIYSAINRMVKAKLIDTTAEIINSRVQKKVKILDNGWEILEMMQGELKNFLSVFEYHEKELDFQKRKQK
ncbi:MAG: PadR family transcriptional regulator [Candidatus Heimdallarchaeota archaeon]|nr:PadR family transcriptional regulator [Candidatus Heimdallarchaeota archaeon]